MKAVWYETNGAAGDVLCHGDMPMPVAGPNEVVVRLYASGVNPSDVKARAGARPMVFDRVIPHSDGAGIIEGVGGDVDGARAHFGQRVFVRNGQWGRAHGTAAEYIAIDAGLVHPLSDKIDFETGAGLGIPALTAAHAVLKDGPIEGACVLVHGGGGTVARLAVQMAVGAGAKVIATTSRPDQHAMLSDLGASAVLDYRDPDIAAQIINANDGALLNRVIDSECGTNLATSIEVLAPKGHIVGYGSVQTPVPALPFLNMMFKNITLSGILVYLLENNAAANYANIIDEMLVEGTLQTPIARSFTLSEAGDAHILVEDGGRDGAVVLQI